MSRLMRKKTLAVGTGLSFRTIGVTSAAAILLTGALAGCGSTGSTSDASQNAHSTTSASSSSSSSADQALTIKDAYTKASSSEMPGMVGSFGVIENHTGKEIQITSATSDASEHVELHETVTKDGKSMMQESAEGLKIPANGSLTLQPGGYHIMLMQLSKDLEPGQNIEITLNGKDGEKLTFDSVVKDISGGNESYHGGENSEHGSDDAQSSSHETSTHEH